MAVKDPWPGFGWRPWHWFRDHARVGSESLHYVSSRLGTSFLVWLLVGIALALPAGLWIVQLNMDGMVAEWQGRPGLSIYFENGASAAAIAAAQETLMDLEPVAEVDVTSAEQALDDFKAYSGLGDALDLLDENPLPASLRAHFVEGVGTEAVELVIARTEVLSGVAEVVVEKTWLERLNDISQVVSRLNVIMAALFGVGAILVTSSSVRLAIESRLEEMRVLKLVGATHSQIRRPFLYFGALYGFGGGVIAAMLIAITLLVIEPPLQSLLGSYQQTLNLAGLDPIFLGALLAIGGALGVLGAVIAVRQRLRTLEIF